MLTFIIIFCIALAFFSSLGLGPWAALFASFGAMVLLGVALNIILAFMFGDN